MREVVRGAQGVAGNIGHIAVPGDTTPRVCGNAGCLDAMAGGRALVTRRSGTCSTRRAWAGECR